MKITFDVQDLQPLVAAIVAETLAASSRADGGINRLAYTEPEAAALLGVRSHVLRDARYRGELRASKLGSRFVYARAELLAFLARRQD